MSDSFNSAQKRLIVQEAPPNQQSASSAIPLQAQVWKKIFALKSRFLKYEQSVFLSNNQKILSAMVMGDTSTMSKAMNLKIETTGTQHIFAISGLHVTLVVLLLNSITNRLPKVFKVMVPTAVLWLVAVVVGLKAALIRAVVMYTISSIAHHLLRRRLPLWWSLLSTVAVMLAYNPWFTIDVGFQLSVVATSGVLIASQVLRFSTPIVGWLTGLDTGSLSLAKTSLMGYLFEGVMMSAVLSLIIAPLSFYYFGSYSFVSILATPLLVWLVPMIMVGWVGELLLHAAGWSWWVLLFLIELPASIFDFILSILQPLSFLVATWKIEAFWMVLSCYAVVLVLLMWFRMKKGLTYGVQI